MICALLALARVEEISAQTAPPTERAGTRDFVEYWSAARVLSEGGNPYAPTELLVWQRTAGWSAVQPLIMWNPPWTLPFVLPFGIWSYSTGQFLWLLVHVGLILASVQRLWQIYSDSGRSSRVAWALVLSFVPAVFVLIIGQITPLVLAGLTWFLSSERKQNSWMMAASLIVLSIKPHILYLFWIIFPLWLVDRRPRGLFLSGALLGLAAVILPVLTDADVYLEYLALYGTEGIPKPMDWPAPTLRNVIRLWFGAERTWLQFAPTVAGIAWAIYYWRRHKDQWRWREQIPIVSMVSVSTSVFVWTYDQVILLPAIIEAAVWLSRSPIAWHKYWTARVYLGVNTCHFLSRFWLAEELWYAWLAPALLINYWIFCRERKKHCAGAPPS